MQRLLFPPMDPSARVPPLPIRIVRVGPGERPRHGVQLQRLYRPSDPVAFPEPYVVAVVRLEEGVTMLSTIVDCAPDDVRVEMPVEVAFERVNDEITLYPFRPAS